MNLTVETLYLAIVRFCQDFPYLTTVSGLCIMAVTYYFTEAVKKPVLLCAEGRYRNFLINNIPLLQKCYWPPLWCYEGRLHTVLASILRSRLPTIVYDRREMFTLADGGQVGLDWLDNEDPYSSEQIVPTDKPIVLFLHGLTGDSQADYLRTLVIQGKKLGYRCVVFNNRGRGGVELTTSRTYCACNVEDLKEIVNHIKSKYPNSPLMGVGISLGGMILAHYLVQTGNKSKLAAAMLVSVVWNVFKGTQSLESPVLNLKLNSHLTNLLIESVKDKRTMFESFKDIDFNRVLKTKTIKEFDTAFTSKVFGFNNIDDYYDKACLCCKLSSIDTPVISLNAEDDPFQPSYSIPRKEISECDCIGAFITARGGHIGFLEGFFPCGMGLIDRLFMEFSSAIFKNLDPLKRLSLSNQSVSVEDRTSTTKKATIASEASELSSSHNSVSMDVIGSERIASLQQVQLPVM